MGDVERSREHLTDGKRAWYDGNSGRKGDATSGARCHSKQVEAQSLAERQAGQHEQCGDKTTGVPEPPNPLPDHHKRPHTHPSPPRRRGRIKTRPQILLVTRQWTYQPWRIEAVSGESNRSDTLYMDSRPAGLFVFRTSSDPSD